jgi:putative hydrolase of the HAD superfamily
MSQKKAIIFDIDNTLVDRKKAFLNLCEYFIEKYSRDYPFEGSKESLIQAMIIADADGYGGLQNFIPRIRKYWKSLPLSTEEFIVERNAVFGDLTVAYPETYEVLEKLWGKYRLGVITNGYSSVQRGKMDTVGITKYFDDIIVSGEQPWEKPDPRIFLLACENLQVKPEEAVFVGDYYPNDIVGAMNAKIMPIWITEHPDEHKDFQGIHIPRLSDLLNYFI